MLEINLQIKNLKRADAVRRYAQQWYGAKILPGTGMEDLSCMGLTQIEDQQTLLDCEILEARQLANIWLQET